MNKHSWKWTCNGLTFDIKWQAIREQNRSGQPILLESPREYDSYPMHQEPKEAWDELLRERAQSIRDQSKRVNIMLSGGRDSTKVVDTFVSNGIFIDEITCIKHGIPEADHEVEKVALPYLAGLDLDPMTRVNVITRSIQDYKQHYRDPYWIEKETRGLLMQFRLTNLSEDLCYANSESGTTWVSGPVEFGLNIFSIARPHLEEIALYKKWIDKKQILKNIKFYGNCDYSKYLKKI